VKTRTIALAAMIAAAACTQPASQFPAPAPAAPAPPSPKPPTPAPVPPTTASAVIRDLAGRTVGTVNFADSHAGVIVTGDVTGVGLGAHGIHIHETGKCESPFTSAGNHFNPTGRKHGFKSADGPHLGDLPNIDTPAAGKLKFEFLLPGVTLKGPHGMLDADGASIIIHGSRDDYASDPSGGSGGRIACGVIIPAR
jgi:superoxide dismutase, Cu-Zn family